MKRVWRTAILSAEVLGLCLSLMACSSPPSQGAAQAPPPSQAGQAQPPAKAEQKEYNLKGKVVSIDKDGKQVAVDGEDIPGFMGAMTMSYPVKDAQFLTSLSPGDQITAKVITNGAEYWLEGIAVVKK